MKCIKIPKPEKVVGGEVVQFFHPMENVIIETWPDACPRAITFPKTATLMAR